MAGHVVSKSLSIGKRLNPGILVLLPLIVSCTTPEIVPGRYQTASITSERSVGPVAELHRKAISAISQEYYPQAIEYLQRAIKIEPRNAFSWHYLAQAYWHSQQYGRCLDMIKRSISYSSKLDDLDRANAALLSQCGES
jgi:tetratricopeptide (TPR) repeat protein